MMMHRTARRGGPEAAKHYRKTNTILNFLGFRLENGIESIDDGPLYFEFHSHGSVQFPIYYLVLSFPPIV